MYLITLCFVYFNTPTKTRGQGVGKAADLTYWDSMARMIVEKSTFPIKTAEPIEKIMTHDKKGMKFQVNAMSTFKRFHLSMLPMLSELKRFHLSMQCQHCMKLPAQMLTTFPMLLVLTQESDRSS